MTCVINATPRTSLTISIRTCKTPHWSWAWWIGCSPNSCGYTTRYRLTEARRIVEDIVTRTVPIVQDFDGFLKLLKPNLAASDHCLVLLYHRGVRGATLSELQQWVRPSMRANAGRTLGVLVNRKDLVHLQNGRSSHHPAWRA